jgi:hypothetical protein
MGEQAPPNFNPSVSLLSGGESATITAVQGGGGFNPDVSMLSGGEGAIIQAVKGGVRLPKALRDLASRFTRLTPERDVFDENNDDLSTIPENEHENENNNNKPKAKAKSNSVNEDEDEGEGEGKDEGEDEIRENEENNDNSVVAQENKNQNQNENDNEDNKEEEENNNNNIGDANNVNDEEEEEEEEEEEDEDEEEDEEEEDEEDGENEKPSIKNNKSKNIDVEIGGIKYDIRPATDETKAKWASGDYSPGEREFMKSIELTEDLLQETFGSQWVTEVAKFFETLVNASCFKEFTLLTKTECEGAREFTKKVHLKLYEKMLKKMTGEDLNSNGSSVQANPNENDEDEENGNSVQANPNENDEDEENGNSVTVQPNRGGSRRRSLPSIGGFKSLHL